MSPMYHCVVESDKAKITLPLVCTWTANLILSYLFLAWQVWLQAAIYSWDWCPMRNYTPELHGPHTQVKLRL